MRVHLISPYCLLRTSTNRIFDVRLCEALAELGCQVELAYLYEYLPQNIARSEIERCYGIRSPFGLYQLPTPLHWRMPEKWQGVLTIPFFWGLALRILWRLRSGSERSLVMARTAISAVPLLALRRAFFPRSAIKIVLQVAEVKSSARYRWIYRHADGLIVASNTAARHLQEIVGPSSRDKIINNLSPVPDTFVVPPMDRMSARRQTDLSDVTGTLVVYTGKLFVNQKEVLHILEAAAMLPDLRFLITGGKPAVVDHYREHCRKHGIGNVIFTGFVDDSTRIRDYQMAADILVSYYTTQDHAVEYNFPQKITEYMAAGRPLVTPNHLATADVLNADNAFFVEAENSAALAAALRRVADDKELAQRLADRAYADVQELTFGKAMQRLLAFVERV